MIPQGISGRFVDPSAVEVDWMKRRLSEIDILADTVDRAEETFGFIIPPPRVVRISAFSAGTRTIFVRESETCSKYTHILCLSLK